MNWNEKSVTIQLCQYWYPSSSNDWLVHSELEWHGRKWSLPVWSTNATFANENLSGYMVPWTRFTQGITIWTNPFGRFVYYPPPLPEQASYSYPGLHQYVHTLAVTTVHCRYIYCMPASAITRTATFISTALHLAKYTSADVNAQSKVRWWASYCSEDPM